MLGFSAQVRCELLPAAVHTLHFNSVSDVCKALGGLYCITIILDDQDLIICRMSVGAHCKFFTCEKNLKRGGVMSWL